MYLKVKFYQMSTNSATHKLQPYKADQTFVKIVTEKMRPDRPYKAIWAAYTNERDCCWYN